MKKIILSLMICMMMLPLAAPAEDSDPFLDDYNTYAVSMYGIGKIAPVSSVASSGVYASDTVQITVSPLSVTLTAETENATDLIAAACCALRVIDNQGSKIDQYGRVLHAYFMARSAGGEKRSVTESSVEIYVSVNDRLTIRVVR